MIDLKKMKSDSTVVYHKGKVLSQVEPIDHDMKKQEEEQEREEKITVQNDAITKVSQMIADMNELNQKSFESAKPEIQKKAQDISISLNEFIQMLAKHVTPEPEKSLQEDGFETRKSKDEIIDDKAADKGVQLEEEPVPNDEARES